MAHYFVLRISHNHRSLFVRQPVFYSEICLGRRKSTYFLTTPIFYVNARKFSLSTFMYVFHTCAADKLFFQFPLFSKNREIFERDNNKVKKSKHEQGPHIGHLYTSLLADAVARFQKMKNPDLNLKFMTGTDEHGLKISLSAEENKMNELDFCNIMSEKYRCIFNKYNISYSDFLRTTEDRHVNTVKMLWNIILKNGFIYKGEYSGWYCVSDEAFISEMYLQPEIDSEGFRYTIDLNKPVHFVKETNYKFRLSHFQNDLLYWLRRGGIIKPLKFEKQLEKWLESEEVMQDVSISRPATRVKWGIPVPNDPSQNIYVWMDALSSYLTSSGYPDTMLHWPPDLHVIGKDILRFHGIYWPAFLMAAGLEPPKSILCHSHWLNDGKKMSKSLGNVVDPMSKLNVYSNEGFRYFILLHGVPHSDGNYFEPEVKNVVNADLADNLGNLLNRCCGKSLNPQQIFPSYCANSHSKYCEKSFAVVESLQALPDSVLIHYENFDFYKGIYEIMAVVSLANKFFQDTEPWNLSKDPANRDHLRAIIHLTMETLRVCGILLQPIVPKLAENLLNRLSVDENRRSFESVRPFSWQNNDHNDVPLSGSPEVLFRRISVN